MTTLTNVGQTWVHTVCRRFSDATGWRLRFTSTDGENPAVVESELQAKLTCSWYRPVTDGERITGFVHIESNAPERDDASNLAVCDLAEIVVQLFERISAVQNLLQTQNEDVSALVDLGNRLPHEDNLPQALGCLLKTALRLTGFRSAAFYLLNSQTNELQLRVVNGIDAHEIPQPLRHLTENPPDLEAFVRGHVCISRSLARATSHWLPAQCATGVCIAVQSDIGPLGTVWMFDRRDRIPSGREEHVLHSIAAQFASVLERVVLMQESAAGHRLQREMQIASESQPTDIVATLRDRRLDVAAVCESRWDVGGDLCELVPLGDNRTLVVVGDASGDSIPAALTMSSVRGALHAVLDQYGHHRFETNLAMQHVNRVLHEISSTHQFMSLFLGVIDTEQRCFTYTNAGHPTPLLLHHREIQLLNSHGLLLGIVPEVDYGTSRLPFNSGDFLVLFSDGITEALSRGHQMFRTDGIVSAVKQADSKSAATMFHAIWTEFEQHSLGGGDPDDRTLMVIRAR